MRWATQWRQVLAVGAAAQRRLAQGEAWVRSGRVTQLRWSDGLLQGRVQGSAATPFAVDIRLRMLSDDDWDEVVDVLAAQARHRAHLVAGQAPEGLEEQLADRGIALLPSVGELDTTCACTDAGWPCLHVAAVWQAAGDQLADDPFGVFRLRGRGRQQLLHALAARRSAGSPSGVAVQELPTRGWTLPRAAIEEVALPELDAPADGYPLLRLLGDPPGWEGRVDAWSSFAPLVEPVARQVAGSVEPADPAPDDHPVGDPPAPGTS